MINHFHLYICRLHCQRINKMDYSNCPNCSTKIKSGLISNTFIIEERKIQFINQILNRNTEAYCSNCYHDLLSQASGKGRDIIDRNTQSLEKLIAILPLISIHQPLGWEYECLSIVTGQTTTGTGVISEFTSSFSDFFGSSSGRHNQKLQAGEQLAFAQMRQKALDLGGNAIIGSAVHYAEIGGDKGMLMVCGSGTAIRLTNTEILGAETGDQLLKLIKINLELQKILVFRDLIQ